MLEARRFSHWSVACVLHRRDQMPFGLQYDDCALGARYASLKPRKDVVSEFGVIWINMQIEVAG
jgi:hypothetical protein